MFLSRMKMAIDMTKNIYYSKSYIIINVYVYTASFQGTDYPKN